MYFGSVKFFRHLILTVVFGWIAIATVLAVFFGIKCHRLENEEKPPRTIEDHITQMTDEGFTVEEIRTFLNRGSEGAVIASADISADSTKAPETEKKIPEQPLTENAVSETKPTAETELSEEAVPTETEPDIIVAEAVISEEPEQTEPVQTEQTAPPQTEKPLSADIEKLYSDMYAAKPANRTLPSSGTVVLTFEGAPSGNMADILIILGRQNAKASFMLSDCGDDDGKEIVKAAYDMGCTMGVLAGENKSYASSSDYLKDFNGIYGDIKDVCGSAPSLYRIPDSAEMSDSVRKDIIDELDRRGFTYCGFNTLSDDRVTGMDWQQLYDTVTSRVFRNRVAGKGSVVQLHGSNSDSLTVFTTEDIILGLKEEGCTFAAFKDTMLAE